MEGKEWTMKELIEAPKTVPVRREGLLRDRAKDDNHQFGWCVEPLPEAFRNARNSEPMGNLVSQLGRQPPQNARKTARCQYCR
jgi:hypothetical protein